MATRTWDAAGADVWSTAASWSDNTKPVTSDAAVFDNTSDQNCTLDENTAILASLNVAAAYGGDIDLDTFNLNVAGDVTIAGAGTFNCGSGAITLANCDLDYSAVGAWTQGTAAWTFNGTCTWKPKTDCRLSTVTVPAGATVTAQTLGGNPTVTVACNQAGTFSVPTGRIVNAYFSCDWSVAATGRVTGAGTFRILESTSGHGLLSMLGTMDVATLRVHDPASGSVFAAGTYASDVVQIESDAGTAKQFAWSAGTTTFTGTSVTCDNKGTSTLTITNAANGAIVLQDCDLILTQTSGTLVWTKGTTGSITFTGSGESNLTVGIANVLDPIVVNKPGGGDLAITTNVACASLTITAGTVACAARTLTISGDMTILPGGSVGNDATSLDGATWTVGGNFVSNGVNLQGTGGWTLSVTGTANIYSAVVSGCNAAGCASPVQARGCVDEGGNTNIVFNEVTGGGSAVSFSRATGFRFSNF